MAQRANKMVLGAEKPSGTGVVGLLTFFHHLGGGEIFSKRDKV